MSEERVKQLQPYWEAWATSFIQNVYSQKEYVRGEDLLHLTPIEGLNKLLIKQLFDEWRQAIEQSKSPYFDYEHPKVKAALQEYANVLSYHIKIDAEAMRQLLGRTLKLYAMLLFSPYHFFVHFFEHNPMPILGIEELKKQLKYIKHYDFLLRTLIERMEQQRMQALPPIALLGLFKVVYEQLGSQLSLDNEAIEAFLALIGYAAEQHSREGKEKAMDLPAEEGVSPPVSTETNGRPLEAATKVQPEEEKNGTKEVLLPGTNQPVEQVEDIADDDEEEYYGGLNERFKQAVPRNISLKLPQTESRSLRDAISLHERFMFVEQLFAGSHHAYHQFIQEMEKVHGLEQTMQVFQRYCREQNWKPSEALDALEAAIKRVFG
ncbi:MAG: hypothetical protein KatS3mg033_0539 [Thermonema sp.]|uniref:hypothetical protein n=1 Tax=Thermonema sp. TaxID=2231181 RepID=UPI0021DC4C7B|nr:hypothetical protein [Thermonema sp.]GIV38739.1 MAG: hypothetical protein KatS3mg033_0539 [Thermonema sp.]